MMDRSQPNVVVRHISPNQSLRSAGAWINLIVLHDTEGHNIPHSIADLVGLGDWFADPAEQVSAHVGTDGDGNSGIYVDSIRKAWHVAHYNSAALGIEQIGFSTDGFTTWESRLPQLHETARWIARWSKMYGIPIQHAHVSNGAVVIPGVITHRELGVLGGNHDDPGVGYPFAQVMGFAEDYRREL